MNDSRVYGGQAVADRRADRRRRFLAAAVELFGTTGYAGTAVPQVCRAAGLSTRQFYQEFSDREDLLRTLYDELQDRAMAQVADATLAAITAGRSLNKVLDAGIRAFLTAYTDPRHTRISFVEVVGVSPAFEDHRHASRARWGELLSSAVAAAGDRGLAVSTVSELQWTAFIGAVNAVVVVRALDPSLHEEELLQAISSVLRPGVLAGK